MESRRKQKGKETLDNTYLSVSSVCSACRQGITWVIDRMVTLVTMMVERK